MTTFNACLSKFCQRDSVVLPKGVTVTKINISFWDKRKSTDRTQLSALCCSTQSKTNTALHHIWSFCVFHCNAKLENLVWTFFYRIVFNSYDLCIRRSPDQEYHLVNRPQMCHGGGLPVTAQRFDCIIWAAHCERGDWQGLVLSVLVKC